MPNQISKWVVVSLINFAATGAKAAEWNDNFDGPDGELLKLYPNQPVGFPNADWIANRTTDNATSEFRETLGRVNTTNAGDPGETRSGSLFSYDDGVNGRNNDMVVLHKDQFTLNPSSAELRIKTSWSPYQTLRDVTVGSQTGNNYIAQVGVMNTFDNFGKTTAAPGITSPPANPDDDLWYSDRDLNDDLTPNEFQRQGLTDRDSFWLGFEEISAIAFQSGSGVAGRGTTTVSMGLYNENGLITTLGSGNYTLDAFYNEYDVSSNRTDGIYFYDIDFVMTYNAGNIDYDIKIDKFLVETTFDNSNAILGSPAETFQSQVAHFTGTAAADLDDTPSQILHVALGYDVQDYDHISNENALYDFGTSIPEPGSTMLLLSALFFLAARRRS